MKIKYFGLFIPLMVGCSPSITTITTINPGAYNTPESRIVYFDHGKEVTWEKILDLSYSSPFQTDMINANAHHVKLRMEGHPDTYIDCGKKRIVTEGHVTTVTNSASHYTYEAYRHRHLDYYSITNHFTGIANVLVTGDKKSSKALIQFELQLRTLQDKTSTQGRQFSQTSERTMKLRSNDEAISPFFGTACRSTGKFEETFLNLISMIKE